MDFIKNFLNAKEIRTVGTEDEPWFVMKDVCKKVNIFSLLRKLVLAGKKYLYKVTFYYLLKRLNLARSLILNM
jgi:hypothetical protein